MKNIKPLDNGDLKHLYLFFYLIPVIGFFPSLWTLYRHGGSRELLAGSRREQIAVSRLSVILAGGWLLGYVLLGFGAETFQFLTLRLLVLNSLLTSGYFLASIWFMVRLSSGKSLRFTGFSRLVK